ncbi:MAG: hypothetical protein KJ587_15500 [Alphaproteobacteria bacterium]|nr:hypothetical protein [Alphaproteobacteria bacterium]
MTSGRKLVIFAAALACMGTFVDAARADDTGMASIHSWKKVGRKTCFVDHTHVGSSSGQKSEKAAVAAAIKDWQEFTAFEYGTDWAYFKNAIGSGKSCSRETAGWTCTVEATPCNRR